MNEKTPRAQTPRPVNPMGRDCPAGYVTLKSGDWTYVVRKLYKSPASSLKDPYARAFCAVKSPMTYGLTGDLGDVYVSDVPGLRQYLQSIVNQIEENK